MDCPSTQQFATNGKFLKEMWAWFAIATFILALRTAVRIRIVGYRDLQLDDHMVVFVWVCFLAESIATDIVYKQGSNLDYSEQELQVLQPCEIAKIEFGSKLQLVAWYAYTGLIWGLKAMMLCFLQRLTVGLKQQKLVKTFALITGFAYLIVFLTISCGCFPLWRNWQVLPLPPPQCRAKLQNFWVTTVLNVLTDALILCIPLPLLWALKVSIARKVVLVILLCSGFFVIAAAILRISFTLKGLNGLNTNGWGTRECIAGVIAVNAPIIRPLFTRSFWSRGPGIRETTYRHDDDEGSPRHRKPKTPTGTLQSFKCRGLGTAPDITLQDIPQPLTSHPMIREEKEQPLYPYATTSTDSVAGTSFYDDRQSIHYEGGTHDLEAGGWNVPRITVETTVTSEPMAFLPLSPSLPPPAYVWSPEPLLSRQRSFGSKTEVHGGGRRKGK